MGESFFFCLIQFNFELVFKVEFINGFIFSDAECQLCIISRGFQ